MGRIRLRFKPDGTVVTETTGFQGQECHAASKPYTELFGATLSDTPTAEAGCQQAAEQQQQQQTTEN